MRIAFLCKRKYMGKDVIDDRYARLYEYPRQLAKLGHDVRAWCLGYQGQPAGTWDHEAGPGTLKWIARSLTGPRLPAVAAYPFHLKRELSAFAPDIIIGASDIPHVVLAKWLSRRLGVPYAVDLYDNFEAFGQAAMPGVKIALRVAVREAQVVTTTSEALADYVRSAYGAKGRVLALPSTIDRGIFHPRDKATCRSQLNLPENGVLIGTAGALLRDRGISTLYAAWDLIADERPDAHLVLAGPIHEDLPPPEHPRVHYLGIIAHERTSLLFSALDLGIIYLRDTPFGRYCFPQKLYEMAACSLPVVGARVGAVLDLLRETPELSYIPDDAESLAGCMREALDGTSEASIPVQDWAQLMAGIEPLLRAAGSRIHAH